jgi:hypothetical protein
MLGHTPITFVVAVNAREVLEKNLLASPCLRESSRNQILLQEGFPSASKCYNDAIDRSENDLVVFLHQDVILPQSWLRQLDQALTWLEKNDPNWGVIGCYGETLNDGGRGHVYSSGRGILGKPFEQPVPVQTLDEIVLIFRKSSGLRFDESLPHFHLYGADICLRALTMGRTSYAISAFCIHNTTQALVLPPKFYESCRYMRRTWENNLPIQTTCVRITRFNIPVYVKRLQEIYTRHIRGKEVGGRREENVERLLARVNEVLREAGPDGMARNS